MLKQIFTSLVVFASVLSISRIAAADGSLNNLADITLPCPAAALEAAANYVKKHAGSNTYFFTSYGPVKITPQEQDAGANEVFWVGFESNTGAKMNLKSLVYCQQGGFHSVAIEPQK